MTAKVVAVEQDYQDYSVGPRRLRDILVGILDATARPVSTAELRLRASERCANSLVVEQIYRSLVILQRQGRVVRVRPGVGRNVYWEVAAGRGGVRRRSAGHRPESA